MRGEEYHWPDLPAELAGLVVGLRTRLLWAVICLQALSFGGKSKPEGKRRGWKMPEWVVFWSLLALSWASRWVLRGTGRVRRIVSEGLLVLAALVLLLSVLGVYP